MFNENSTVDHKLTSTLEHVSHYNFSVNERKQSRRKLFSDISPICEIMLIEEIVRRVSAIKTKRRNQRANCRVTRRYIHDNCNISYEWWLCNNLICNIEQTLSKENCITCLKNYFCICNPVFCFNKWIRNG